MLQVLVDPETGASKCGKFTVRAIALTSDFFQANETNFEINVFDVRSIGGDVFNDAQREGVIHHW